MNRSRALKVGIAASLVSLITCFVACGGVSNDLVGEDSADGGTSSDGSTRDGGSPRDSGSVKDSATSADDSGASSGKTGLVAAVSTYLNGAVSFQASFDDPSLDGPPASSLVLGGCTATLAAAIPTLTNSPESGSIVFTSNTDAGVLDETLTPETNGQYTAQSESLGLVGGEFLHVASTGGDVPAFAVDLNFPLALLASDSLVNATTFDSSTDLTITLQRGAKDLDFYFGLTGTNGTATTYADAIVCFLPSESGTVVVPKQILAYVPKGSYTFSAYSAQVTVVNVGGYAVSVDAVGPVLNAAKTQAPSSVAVTLQ